MRNFLILAMLTALASCANICPDGTIQPPDMCFIDGEQVSCQGCGNNPKCLVVFGGCMAPPEPIPTPNKPEPEE